MSWISSLKDLIWMLIHSTRQALTRFQYGECDRSFLVCYLQINFTLARHFEG